MWYKNIAGRFFGLVTKHACARQTDRQNYDSQDRPSIASRGNQPIRPMPSVPSRRICIIMHFIYSHCKNCIKRDPSLLIRHINVRYKRSITCSRVLGTRVHCLFTQPNTATRAKYLTRNRQVWLENTYLCPAEYRRACIGMYFTLKLPLCLGRS